MNVTVEVIVDTLKDKKYYNTNLEIIRNGKPKSICQRLLLKGDSFETDKVHAKYLSELGCVSIIKDKKQKEE